MFEQNGECQYSRELPFSTVVELMAPVTMGLDVGPGLPGWQVRIIDDNHLQVSDR